MTRILHRPRDVSSREVGNAIIIAVMVLSFLAALSAAQFVVVQRNIQASTYFLDHSDLHTYAESGVDIGLYDLKNKISSNGEYGKIGTSTWTTANDFGEDGASGTYDKGEGDGIPTLGEPNVTPQAIGPTELGATVFVYVADTAYANVQRVVSTASNGTASATVSTYVKKSSTSVPDVGAVYVDPDVALDLKGNKFLIDGNDYNPDGTPGPGPAMPGIATELGSPPGTNTALLLGQLDSNDYDQVLGLGGEPSLAETSTTVDLEGIFDSFKAVQTTTLTPGTYSSPTMGTSSAMEVTYVNGDIHLTGQGTGAGVLLVDGEVQITGQFEFQGLVIVKGDVKLSGGGAGTHIFGTLMVGESITAIDPDLDLTVSGNADVFYSSVALQNVASFLSETYSVVYYEDN